MEADQKSSVLSVDTQYEQLNQNIRFYNDIRAKYPHYSLIEFDISKSAERSWAMCVRSVLPPEGA